MMNVCIESVCVCVKEGRRREARKKKNQQQFLLFMQELGVVYVV